MRNSSGWHISWPCACWLTSCCLALEGPPATPNYISGAHVPTGSWLIWPTGDPDVRCQANKLGLFSPSLALDAIAAHVTLWYTVLPGSPSGGGPTWSSGYTPSSLRAAMATYCHQSQGCQTLLLAPSARPAPLPTCSPRQIPTEWRPFA